MINPIDPSLLWSANKITDLLKDKSPIEIITWALSVAKNPVVTTNFRPYEVAILHACTQIDPELKVIWCDTGYNTPQTYKHANELINSLGLNVHLYVPEQTSAYRDSIWGFLKLKIHNMQFLLNK